MPKQRSHKEHKQYEKDERKNGLVVLTKDNLKTIKLESKSKQLSLYN